MGYKILFILLGLNMLLSSCNQLAWEARHLQRHLHEQQRRAEDLTQHLYHSIETNNFDSLWAYSQEDENIVFYVYYGDKKI